MQKDAVGASSHSAKRGSVGSPPPRTILLVDDLPKNLELLSEIFIEKEYRTVTADDGEMALRVLETETVDIIVADVMMPKLDGFQLCQQVRSNPRWASIPFVVYSGNYIDEEDRKFAAQLGVDRYVMKGSRISELLNAVEDLLREKPRPEAAPVTDEAAHIDDQEFLEKHHAIIGKKLSEKINELRATAEKLSIANRELAASETRYRMLFENATVAIFILHPVTGVVLDINNRASLLLDRPRSDIIGSRFQPPGNALGEVLERVHQEGHYNGPFILPRSESEPIEIEIDAGLFGDDLDAPQIMVFARDVTEQNRLKRKLLQAERMTLMGCLAAGIAHEIKNPLTAVSLNLQFIEQKCGTEFSEHDSLEAALDATRRVQEVIENTLNLARVAPPAMKIENVNRLVQQISSLLKIQLRQRSLTLANELEEGLPEIVIDAKQTQQVLINVLQNAIEASETGQRIVVRTFLERSAPNLLGEQAEHLAIAITDQGHGISAAQMEKMFEPLRTTKQGGTGIGLALAKHIMEQHSGRIEVRSQPGAGTTVTLLFPIIRKIAEAV